MKILPVVLSLVLFGVALSYWLPLEGRWLDPIVSRYFSQQIDRKLLVHGAKISHWNRIHFKSLDILVLPGLPKFQAGPGFVKLKSFPFPTQSREQAVVVMKDVVLPAPLTNKLPLSFLTHAESLKKALAVEHMKLSISKEGAATNYHLLECSSRELSLRGGLTVTDSKIVRVHALFFLRNELLDKIPENVRSRLIDRADGWRGLRVHYSRHTLIALGGKGPFFKADWK